MKGSWVYRSSRWSNRLVGARLALLATLLASVARGQSPPPRPVPRPVTMTWDAEERFLRASFAFRDAVTASVRRKLSRGLPTTIVLTATLHRPGQDSPLSTTVQSCRVTWLVWDEVFRVELVRPDRSEVVKTVTVSGVLRRCAEAKDLLVATREQLAPGIAVQLTGRVQVNPVSPELLQKLKRWVSRPSSTGTAAPGDALFSTFTGLFLQRVAEAERTLDVVTVARIPRSPARSRPAARAKP